VSTSSIGNTSSPGGTAANEVAVLSFPTQFNLCCCHPQSVGGALSVGVDAQVKPLLALSRSRVAGQGFRVKRRSFGTLRQFMSSGPEWRCP
jgi:hypothetical protein